MKKKIISIISLTMCIMSFSQVCFALDKPVLPEVNMEFKRPENMPDINMNLDEKYNTIMEDLDKKGFGENNYKDVDFELPKLEDIDLEDMFNEKFGETIKVQLKENNDYSIKGFENKWDQETFDNYLKTAEEKYLPQINASKNQKLEYEKIDLSGKWGLASYENAKNNYYSSKSSNSNSYAALLNGLNSKPSLTNSSEFNDIKAKVQSNTANQSDIFKGLVLPDGVSFNGSGLIDNREPPTIVESATNTVKSGFSGVYNYFKNKTEAQGKQETMDKIIESYSKYGRKR